MGRGSEAGGKKGRGQKREAGQEANPRRQKAKGGSIVSECTAVQLHKDACVAKPDRLALFLKLTKSVSKGLVKILDVEISGY